MDTIQVKVEFSGLSRILAKANDMQLSLSPRQTYVDVIRLVAEKYPALVGNVIDKSKTDLFPSNIFSRNGKTVVMPDQLNDCPRDGEVLILLSLLAGG
ncbi:MAG: MoaD/ThiS family protein [Anaerolineaceae bacterium]